MAKGGARFGAGRPGWKAKAEQSLPLDVRAFHQRGILRPEHSGGGSWRWTWNGTDNEAGRVGYSYDDEKLELRFMANGENRVQSIPVVRTRCHFGGARPWFLCPVCVRRVAVLYQRGGRFACRRCQRVAYLSQSEDVVGRAWRKQSKVERLLGSDGERPKGMHRTTYERLLSVIDECETAKEWSLYRLLERMGVNF